MAWRLVREVVRQLLSIAARRMAYMVESADAPEAAVADALTYSWAYGGWPSSPTAGTSPFRYHFPPTASSTASSAAPASGQGDPDGGQVRLPLRRAGGKRGPGIGHGPLGGQPAAVVSRGGGQLGGVRRPGVALAVQPGRQPGAQPAGGGAHRLGVPALDPVRAVVQGICLLY